MLEGLEISEIRLSDLERTKRIDSQFYSHENLSATNRLDAFGAKPLTDFVAVSDGNHMGVSDQFIDDVNGVPYYRGSDIYNLFIEQSSSPMRIDRNTFLSAQMARSHLRKGDVLMSIVGAVIGNLSLVTQDVEAACSCKLAILRPHAIRAELLSVFLSSYFGQVQIQKFKRGAAQTGLILEDFDQLKIPNLSKKFELAIVSIVQAAYGATQSSRIILLEAENLLLKTINLADFIPSKNSINIKFFNESFKSSSRLDAEYYQTKYEEMNAKVKRQNHLRLGDLVHIQKSMEPGSDAYTTDEDGLPFLRVADYSKQGTTKPQVRLSKDYVFENAVRIEALKPKQGTILFSKDGSVGEAYLLTEDVNLITSSAILHFTVKDKKQVLPEYLTLMLNSFVIRMQAERDAGGSVILHWQKDQIENVIVPIIDLKSQKKITTLVQDSFRLKARSDSLLKVAKHAVEMAIEKSEAAGLAYLKRESASA